jgi:hypothetical protein
MDGKQKINESEVKSEWAAGKPRTAAKTPTGSGNKKKKSKKNKIVLRVALWLGIPLLLIGSLIGGLLVGYTVVGNEPASEIWDLTALKHMVALVFGG